MKIMVGSLNPAKIGAVRDAFKRAYPSLILRVNGTNVSSNVPSQPKGDVQCISGARNRARVAFVGVSGADFAVGIESGICIASYGGVSEGWFDRTWVVVRDKDGKEGIGSSISFRVSNTIANELRTRDIGLGRIMNARSGKKDISKAEGYSGIATGGILYRREITRDAIIAALAVFLNPDLFVESHAEADC